MYSAAKYPAYLKKNRAGGTIFPNFKLYYNATVTKTVWYWHKTDIQANETEQTAKKEIKPCTSSQLIFDKVTRTKAKEKRKPLQQTVLGKLDSQMQNNEIEPVFYTI